MLVKDCFVDDGKDNRKQILNSDGCPVDDGLMGELEYSSRQSEAVAQATVFKWPDEPAVFFSCGIRVCAKNGGECDLITVKSIEISKSVQIYLFFKFSSRPNVIQHERLHILRATDAPNVLRNFKN